MPDADTALRFAIMLGAGAPQSDAIRYFLPEANEGELKAALRGWMSSPVVRRAILKLEGKEWQEKSLEERIQFAIDKHYSEVAYYLYVKNYAELEGAERAKADVCRQVLEAKLAGMAGKTDALSRFFADVQSGKVRLGPPSTPSAPTTH